MDKTLNFIEKARKIHGDKYDYSKVEYVNSHSKVCIICPTHGEFWQRPNDHLSKKGCPLCGRKRPNRYTTETFVQKCQTIFPNYNYTKTVYNGSHKLVTIICPIHGEFKQIAYVHLQGHGCPHCGLEEVKTKNRKSTTKFIFDMNKKYQNQYKLVSDYVNNKTKVEICCTKCGNRFWVRPDDFLNRRHKCQCDIEKDRKKVLEQNKEFFLKNAKEIHGDKYDYSYVNYKGYHEKVKIFCKECDNFFWQTPAEHINKKHGCLFCKKSRLESNIITLLKKKKIEYLYQVTNRKFKWLSLLSLDFYLPQYKVAIECQGIQHFQAIDFFGGKKAFEQQVKRDTIKKQLCEENGVKLIYYSDLKDVPSFVIRDKEEILNFLT